MLMTNYPPRRDDDIDGWFEYFQREIANYKQAIRRVIQDVLQLREQHKTLTAANQDLKTKIENFDKKKRVLYEIFEGDKIDKAKIRDIFSKFCQTLLRLSFISNDLFVLDSLNAKISAQALALKESNAKISNYEKELARVRLLFLVLIRISNEFFFFLFFSQRTELRGQYDALIRTTQAREVELNVMRERLIKADGLEETVRRQELVIEKLEAMINNYLKEKRLRGAFNDVDRTFLSEHAALGLENQQLQVKKNEIERRKEKRCRTFLLATNDSTGSTFGND